MFGKKCPLDPQTTANFALQSITLLYWQNTLPIRLFTGCNVVVFLAEVAVAGASVVVCMTLFPLPVTTAVTTAGTAGVVVGSTQGPCFNIVKGSLMW